jgi:probable phosphoglycerate mutase
MGMKITRLVAVRHGETAWNVDTRIQGQLDIGLNDNGRWQARRVAQALIQEPVHAIYASDLQRAWHTAQSISESTGTPVRPESGLRERRFGLFEGKTFQEIEAAWPEQANHWRKRVPEWAPPEGGESLLALRERVRDTVDQIAAGADVSRRDARGACALHWAVRGGSAADPAGLRATLAAFCSAFGFQ